MLSRLLLVISLLVLFTLFIPTTYACHQPGKDPSPGQPPHSPNTPPDPNSGPCPAGIKEIEEVFTNFISVITGLGFMVMLVLLVWAGYKYLMSGGEPKAIQSAHQTVTWALMGVVFMAVAWIVLQLIHVFTGINVTFFNIRTLFP